MPFQDPPSPESEPLREPFFPGGESEPPFPGSRDRLRQAKIRARDRLDPAVREALSRRIVERIVSRPEFQRAGTVLIYRAIRGEVRLSALETAAETAGKRLVYPRCTGSRELTAYLPQSPQAWKPGRFGIEEPVPEQSALIPPEDLDLILCPCTVFDDRCGRMGMGGGFYDRYLPRCRNAFVAAVAFEVQKASQVPMAAWDRFPDLVLTEAAVYRNPMGPGRA